MAEYDGRIPKKGELVGAMGHTGGFRVVSTDLKVHTADLKLSNGVGPVVLGVPWTTLVFPDDE